MPIFVLILEIYLNFFRQVDFIYQIHIMKFVDSAAYMTKHAAWTR